MSPTPTQRRQWERSTGPTGTPTGASCSAAGAGPQGQHTPGPFYGGPGRPSLGRATCSRWPWLPHYYTARWETTDSLWWESAGPANPRETHSENRLGPSPGQQESPHSCLSRGVAPRRKKPSLEGCGPGGGGNRPFLQRCRVQGCELRVLLRRRPPPAAGSPCTLPCKGTAQAGDPGARCPCWGRGVEAGAGALHRPRGQRPGGPAAGPRAWAESLGECARCVSLENEAGRRHDLR